MERSEPSLLSKSAELPDLTIVLIGKVGAGKTSFLNTLLSFSENNEYRKPVPSYTDECQETNVKIGNQSLVVVDTPGLSDEKAEDIKRYVDSDLGPCVFLFVMEPGPFTQLEKNMVELFWNTFAEYAAQYTLVLFTRSTKLGNKRPSGELQKFVSKCNNKPFYIDNKTPDLSEVTTLLQFIHDMVDKKEKKGYTCEDAEKERWSQIIKLSVLGCALVGAGVGAVAAYFVGGAVGILGGVPTGAAVGGVVGFVGVVVAGRIKNKN